MKDTYKNKWQHYTMLFLIYGIGMLTLFSHTIYHQLLHPGHGEEDVVYAYEKCDKTKNTHTILILHNTFIPNSLTVKRCDVITFDNEVKNAFYSPALGEHSHHIHYAGFTEKVIGFGEKNSFIAHSTGTFLFHDHQKNQIEGSLTIKP